MCNIEIIFFVFVIIFVYIAFVLFCLCKKSINWRLGQHDYEFQEIVKKTTKEKFIGNKLQIRLLMYRNSVQIKYGRRKTMQLAYETLLKTQ